MKVVFDATDYVVAITGAANGIGRTLARSMAEAGATVVALDIDEKALAALAELHDRIEPRILNVADRNAVFETFRDIEKQHGKIDGLVCGAAIQPRTQILDMAPEEWRGVQEVNLDGVMWCYQAVCPGMIKRRRGSIIAFTSGLAGQGWPAASAYASTKAALIAFAKSAAKEILPHRVRFNIIAPGVIDTPQYRNANEGADNDTWKATLGVGEPEDVVGPLMFLLSDEATMSGSLLARDMAFARRDNGDLE